MEHLHACRLLAACCCALGLSAQAGPSLSELGSKLGASPQSTENAAPNASALGALLGGQGNAAAALSALGVVPSGSASNAAGVITYCIQNNYLSAKKATQVKDQLLDKLGLGTQKEPPKDEGYLSGLAGLVTGSDGKTFELDKLKGNLKEKACDFVLDNAQRLL